MQMGCRKRQLEFRMETVRVGFPVIMNRSWIYRVLIYIHDTFHSIYSGGQNNHAKVGAHKNMHQRFIDQVRSNLHLCKTKRDIFIFVTPPILFHLILFRTNFNSLNK